MLETFLPKTCSNIDDIGLPVCARDLWLRRDVADPATEIGAVQGGDDLEAIRDISNGRRVGVVTLRQTSRTCLAALWAPQFFVPLIDHGSR